MSESNCPSPGGVLTEPPTGFAEQETFLRALGHYYLMGAAWCGAAAVSYWARGALDLSLTLPALAGAVAGGYLGSRIGNRLGGAAVRSIFIGGGLILGGKLLLGW